MSNSGSGADNGRQGVPQPPLGEFNSGHPIPPSGTQGETDDVAFSSVSIEEFNSRFAVPRSSSLETLVYRSETIVDGSAGKVSPSLPTMSAPAAIVPDVSVSAAPRAPEAAPIDRGTVVGNYRILGPLGSGGMGVIYKAWDDELNRPVALKVIHSLLGSPREYHQRFVGEARAVAKLRHRGIVQIHEIGSHQGIPYIAFEFVDGRDLQSLYQGQALPSDQAARITWALCDAMQYTHDHGILHRDLKPANVLIDSDQNPRITDFGLAKHLDSDEVNQTLDGTILGSPSYMSPEQAAGRLSAMSIHSDIYSLGAILFQLLTGRPPFLTDRPLDTVFQVIHSDPVRPRDLQPRVPVDLETICLKALRKDPAARYQSCQEFADDLGRFLAGHPILARPVSPFQMLVRWCRRNQKQAGLICLCFLALTSTAVVSTWSWHNTFTLQQRAEQERDTAHRLSFLAIENEQIAREQAQTALKSVQFVIREVEENLKGKPELRQTRLALLDAAVAEWDRLDLNLTGGIRGEAIPTLMSIRFELAKAYADVRELEKADAELAKLTQNGIERLNLNGRSAVSLTNLAKICHFRARIRHGLVQDASLPVFVEAAGFAREAQERAMSARSQPSSRIESNEVSEALDVCAATHQNLGTLLLAAGELEGAIDALQTARSSLWTLLKIADSMEQPVSTPADVDPLVAVPASLPADLDKHHSSPVGRLQQKIDQVSNSLADALLRAGRTDQALETYRVSVDTHRRWHQEHPAVIDYKFSLAEQLREYGVSLLWLDRFEDAESVLKESQRHMNGLNATVDSREFREATIETLYQYARALQLGNNADEADRSLHRCRSLCRQLLEESPSVPVSRILMLTEARFGNYRACRAAVAQVMAPNHGTSEAHFDRSCAMAQLILHVSENSRSAVANEALKALERSISLGFHDRFRMLSEPDLDPLRTEPEFDMLLQRTSTQSTDNSRTDR
ncbi:MAG: serine/threonine protein kinase [Planctomycetaceae bacterium]|nr:serine/threonine protein kinase [Planctomycetaceae bacterium]